jgi:hypothetical protein
MGIEQKEKKALPGLRDIVRYGRGEDGDRVPGEWGIDISDIKIEDGKVFKDCFHSFIRSDNKKINEWKLKEVSIGGALKRLNEDEMMLKQYKDDIEKGIQHIQQAKQQVLELKEKQEKK